MDVTRFSDITKDLVENILMRLSVKCLKRFSCVNKWWYDLIHDPYFISRHYSHHSSFNQKLLVRRSLSNYVIGEDVISILCENDGDCSSIPLLNQDNFVTIIGPSINGIVCLKISTHGKYFDDIALWNVATGEYKILPRLQFSSPPKAYLEPRIVGLGFGWVPETNEFKVVMSIVFIQDIDYHDDYILHYRPPEVYVYTLSTNSWKQLCFEFPFPAESLQSDPPHRSQIYVNGVCYWINQIFDDRSCELFSFHVRDDVFETLQLPETQNHDFYLPKLYVLDGCISLMLQDFSSREKSVFLADIWVMEESWIKKFTIGPLLNIRMGLRPVKDEFLLVDESDQLLSININSHRVKNLGIQGGKFSFHVLEYVESLVILKCRL